MPKISTIRVGDAPELRSATASRILSGLPFMAKPEIRNVVVNGHRTSLSLDGLTWDCLADIAGKERMSLHELATSIAANRGTLSLTQAVRSFVMAYISREQEQQAGSPSFRLPSALRPGGDRDGAGGADDRLDGYAAPADGRD